ncbi:MAG: hypothetical protein HOC43_10810, partial [Planctomycetes bacterium]|nr:hypothetical protein [Planctomycetota bacterium]
MHSFTKVFFLALLICDPLNASQETAIQSPPTGDNLYTLHQATQSLITAQDLERGDALPYPWQSSFGIQSSIGHGLAEQANTISLVSGAFQPKPGVETQVQAIASRQGYAHAWVQPVDGIRAGFLDSLHELGIQTFSSLSGAVQAKIPASALQALASRRDIRWVGTLPSQAKFHPVLASLIATQQDQQRLPIWVSLMGDSGVEGPTATTFITPSLRADATQVEQGQASSFDPSASPFGRRMTKAGLKVKAYRENTRTFAVDATVEEIMTLSALNEVHFLSARAQFKPMNDKGASMSGNANIWADYQNGTLNSVTTVGVIDSGFALHTDLAVERIHFSNGGLDAEQDVYGHGTQVLGALMGRGLSDVDAKGANPFLASRTVGRVWLARYFDDAGNPVGDINDLYTALSTAQSGSWIPKVINCSWGASPLGGAAYSGTEQECLDIDAIAYATK